jgi:hypothetical protein
MHDQRLTHKDGTGIWLATGRCNLIWSIMLLFCVGVIVSCGAPPTTTTALQQSPQPTKVTHPFHSTVKTWDGDFTVALDITPNRPGTNVFMLHALDNHTYKPVMHADITLYTTMQDMPMGTVSVILHADRQSQFSAASNNLSMNGRWAIGITIQTPDHIVHKAGVNLMTPSQ